MACAAAAGGQATAATTAGRACAGGELVIAVRPHNTINDKKTDRGETEEAQSKWHEDSRWAPGQLASAAAAIGMPTPRRPLASPCGGRVVLLLVPALLLLSGAAPGSVVCAMRWPRHAVYAAVRCWVIAQQRPGLRQLRLADGR